MTRYSIQSETFGAHEAWRLSDHLGGATALIARRGATLLSWQVREGAHLRTLSDGHQTPAELEAQSGMRFGLMAPFSNRIADARYSFDGIEHDLQPGVAGAQRGIRHGFVRHADFDLVDTLADDTSALLRLSTQVLRPGAFAGYPFSVDVEVAIRLRGSNLDYAIEARNVGTVAAPFGCGLHPYFRLADDGIERLELQVPARALVLTDPALIPQPGDAAFAAVEATPALDFRTSKTIAGRVIDQAYCDLLTDPDGVLRSRLRDPQSGIGVAVWQTRGLLHAFTGDTVSRDRRASMALEPVEFPTNAYNREDCAASLRLEPGAVRSFRCGFEIFG